MTSPLNSPLSNTGSGKHTVYIDIDDEITAIIEKVKASPEKIVALVLPKRATVLQSVVNMKLLKKSAHSAKKSLVLITSEVGLLPLASAIGLHVAKTLQSRPEIPLPPDHEDTEESEISEVDGDDESDIDKTKSVGALSAAASVAYDETETIELDDVDIEDNDDETDSSKSKKKSSKFKVPNFDRFRLSFFLAILAVILLIGGWILAAVVLPEATVVIKTDTNTQVSNINFTASTAAKDLIIDQAMVPAVQKEVKKTDTEKATPTGKKDNGTKATGTMTVFNCTDNDVNVPASTTFSSSSLSYVSDSTVLVPSSDFFSAANGGGCKKNHSATVAVTAVNGGTGYNQDAGHNYTSNFSSTVTGTGSVMTGGTTNVVTIVSQADVDGAASKMKTRQNASAETDLAQALLADSLRGLDETKTVSEPVITSTPAVGAEATGEITVTSVTTYTILGVKSDFLNQLIKKDVSTKMDTSKEGILDNGLGAAVIRIIARKNPTDVQMSLKSIVVSGPILDANAIKEQIRGKKSGDAMSLIKSKPGVKDVEISYKPFWVLSTPKAAKHITVTIQKPVVKPAVESSTANDSNP